MGMVLEVLSDAGLPGTRMQVRRQIELVPDPFHAVGLVWLMICLIGKMLGVAEESQTRLRNIWEVQRETQTRLRNIWEVQREMQTRFRNIWEVHHETQANDDRSGTATHPWHACWPANQAQKRQCLGGATPERERTWGVQQMASLGAGARA